MYILDLHFQVLLPVYSLPLWHGARWSAWFRESCRELPFRLEDFALSLLPERSGQRPFLPGEQVSVRLVVSGHGLALLPAFFRSLAATVAGGEFSARSLRLAAVHSWPHADLIWHDDRPTDACARPFAEADFGSEIAALAEATGFELQFAGPLRLPLPAGLKRGGADVDKFCRPEHFAEPRLFAHLLARIRGLEQSLAPCVLPALDVTGLYWDDMRYNQNRRIALGGVCGKIRGLGQPGPALARLLVLGQYLGAGKNGRFGLGFWKLATLAEPVRRRANRKPGQARSIREIRT